MKNKKNSIETKRDDILEALQIANKRADKLEKLIKLLVAMNLVKQDIVNEIELFIDEVYDKIK